MSIEILYVDRLLCLTDNNSIYWAARDAPSANQDIGKVIISDFGYCKDGKIAFLVT